jgi:hypothetical protein
VRGQSERTGEEVGDVEIREMKTCLNSERITVLNFSCFIATSFEHLCTAIAVSAAREKPKEGVDSLQPEQHQDRNT